MGIKVVFNSCYGGFSISKKCAERMAERGNEEAKELLKVVVEDDYWYGGWDGDRHDPVLVEAVEKLGAEASGDCGSLAWVTIEGDRYIIKEYDGYESVVTPEDINWVVVQPTGRQGIIESHPPRR